MTPRADGGIARVHDADGGFALPAKRPPEVARPVRATDRLAASGVAVLLAKLHPRARVRPLPIRTTPPRARSHVHRIRSSHPPDEPPQHLARS